MDKTSLLTCCADLYQHPLVEAVLGESWHPGGLPLTRSLAKDFKLSKDADLLDVACGGGASALMLAQIFKCRVTGVDASAAAIERAGKEARRYRLENLATFIAGDATQLPFPSMSFTAAMCECATSIFSDKQAAFAEMARVLRPGGYLAMSDVTFRPPTLPEPMDSPLAQALCIPLGTGPEEYVHLLEQAGLQVTRRTDCSAAVAQIIDKVESLLGMGPAPTLDEPMDREPLYQIKAAVRCARQLLQQGDLGYWAFVARKP